MSSITINIKKVFLLLTLIFLSFNTLNAQNSMIKIEGGTFKMGSKDNAIAADNDEQNEHDVTVKSFEISKYEVTV